MYDQKNQLSQDRMTSKLPNLKILARALAAYSIASNNDLEFIKSINVISDSLKFSGFNNTKAREAG